MNEKFRKESESDFAFMSVFGVVTRGRGVQRKTSGRRVDGVPHRSLPIVYLIYLAFQVDPEEVGAGGIY